MSFPEHSLLESFYTSDLSDEDRATLREAGYVPVLRWQKQHVGHTVLCSTGEALANVASEKVRKR